MQLSIITHIRWLYWPSRIVGLMAYNIPKDRFKGAAETNWRHIILSFINLLVLWTICYLNINLNMDFMHSQSVIISTCFQWIMNFSCVLVIYIMVLDVLNRKRAWGILTEFYDFDHEVCYYNSHIHHTEVEK